MSKRNQPPNTDANKRPKSDADAAGGSAFPAIGHTVGSVATAVVSGQHFQITREATDFLADTNEPDGSSVRREESTKFQEWQNGDYNVNPGQYPPTPSDPVPAFSQTLLIANDTTRETSHIAIDVCRYSKSGEVLRALGDEFEIEISLVRSGVHGSCKQGQCEYTTPNFETHTHEDISTYHKNATCHQNLKPFKTADFTTFKTALKAAAAAGEQRVQATCRFRVDQVTRNDAGNLAQLRITITEKSTRSKGELYSAPIHVLSKLPEESAKDKYMNGDVGVLKKTCGNDLQRLENQISQLKHLINQTQRLQNTKSGQCGLALTEAQKNDLKDNEALLGKLKMPRCLVRRLDSMAATSASAPASAPATAPASAPASAAASATSTAAAKTTPHPVKGHFMRQLGLLPDVCVAVGKPASHLPVALPPAAQVARQNTRTPPPATTETTRNPLSLGFGNISPAQVTATSVMQLQSWSHAHAHAQSPGGSPVVSPSQSTIDSVSVATLCEEELLTDIDHLEEVLSVPALTRQSSGGSAVPLAKLEVYVAPKSRLFATNARSTSTIFAHATPALAGVRLQRTSSLEAAAAAAAGAIE